MTDIDDLIRQIRSEAADAEHRYDLISDFEPLPFQSKGTPRPTDFASLEIGLAGRGLPGREAAENVETVDDLLLEANVQRFVSAAYERILRRPADAAGAHYYASKLEDGFGQTFVIAALCASREAQVHGNTPAGMGLALPCYNLWRVLRHLGLGRIGRFVNGAYNSWRHLRLLLGGRLTSELTRRRELQASLYRQVDVIQRRVDEREAERAALLDELQRLATASERLRAQADDNTKALEAGEAINPEIGAALQDLRRSRDQLGDELSVLHASFVAHREAAALPDAGRGAPAPEPRDNHDRADAQPVESEGGAASSGDAGLAGRISEYYLAFESRYRGEESKIRAQQRIYLNRLETLSGELQKLPVIDIGCGRGEWLALLRDAGLAGTGIDSNPVMIGHCESQGLTVRRGDALQLLPRMQAGSAAAVTAFHVVEHLPFAELFQLLEQAYRVLAPGGLLMLETPNPENVLVGSHTFYHDFSHRNPVTPESLKFLVTHTGFRVTDLERLHPYGEEAYIREDTLAAERINGHLYGPQDYALFAERSRSAAPP